MLTKYVSIKIICSFNLTFISKRFDSSKFLKSKSKNRSQQRESKVNRKRKGQSLGGTTCAVKCVHGDILTPLQRECAECAGGFWAVLEVFTAPTFPWPPFLSPLPTGTAACVTLCKNSQYRFHTLKKKKKKALGFDVACPNLEF
jgi:hypothetical protein